MMDYIAGQIHEILQKENFFVMNSSFSWINCRDKRLHNSDWGETDIIELSKGDVIVVRFFKSKPTLTAYTYLERVIYSDKTIEYKKESSISKDLIDVNPDLFTDVTKAFTRNNRIEDLGI